MPSLGIDVGGANLKVASPQEAEIIYFPIWKRASELEAVLCRIAERFGCEKVGVVMTAELADVFESKEEGVKFVAEACRKAFSEVYFLDVDGGLCSEIDDPRRFAASNWVASARFLLEEGYENFLFVDVGSTTADLIPVTDRIEAAKSDFERLQRGELLYFGILRTPVFYVLESFMGAPLCSEFFAVTADVFTLTGDIGEEDYTCDTPDGKGRKPIDCARRLARTICCDLEELGFETAKNLAFAAKAAMVEKLASAMRKKFEECKLDIVLACGIGEFLIEAACKKIGAKCTALSKLYGDYSKLFPAFAMMKLVEKL